MKPVLLLDLSTLQNLVHEEAQRLQHHFFLNVPPVLFLETLADLERPDKASPHRQDQVKAWTSRMLLPGVLFNMDHRHLCRIELLGAEFEMGGSAIPEPPKRKRLPNGEILNFHDVTWQNRALIRWLEGRFADEDRSIAEDWRKHSCVIDVQKYEGRLAKEYVIVRRVSDVRDVVSAVEDILSNPNMQDFCLEWLMEEFSFRQSVRDAIYTGWRMRPSTYLKDFAPYAHYCVKVSLAFAFGLVRGQIASLPEKKSRVDLEYCYYLPFCMAFASTDRFHKNLAPPLLRENQDFIEGNVLKADLKHLNEEWQSLTPEQKRQRDVEYGDYPVENSDSVIWKIWRKQAGPRTSDYGNRAPLMTKEKSDELVRHINSTIDATDQRQTGMELVELNEGAATVKTIISLMVPRSEMIEHFPNFEQTQHQAAETENEPRKKPSRQ
ncbi:MAG TPA: hypothetical protein VNL17_05790 [Verrucomicrobiae bacterium]|nr:hypothetical protein [Verrucomicrobiae bacterium]